ncbi:MAG: hypothetical protein ACXWI6_06420 [Burkholderiales bacterium]
MRDASTFYRMSCPDSEPEPRPDREVPNPSVTPDMEPVVPQQDPPQPGRPGDGQPPPIIA